MLRGCVSAIRRLIFVPTYNEIDNAPRMVEALSALPVDADLLFMDDDSPDGTGKALDSIAMSFPRLTVLHRSGKLGIGSAHAEGIAWAYDHAYDILITLDCDFTHKPTDVMRVLEALHDHDLATGSRYMAPDSLPEWNILRRSLTSFGHLLTRRLLGIPYDATGALRAYDLRRIRREVFDEIEAGGYGFFFESMYVLTRRGYRVGEFAIVLPARTYGSSKMTLRETMRSGTQLLTLWGKSFLRSTSSPHQVEEAAASAPQDWDSYWNTKERPSGKVYDLIAGAYRNLIIRRNLEAAIFDTYEEGSHLLHAGCGSGGVDVRLHAKLKITAVDKSDAAIRTYTANNPSAHAVENADIMALPFPSDSFDGAYNLGVLEHFTTPEIERILNELNRVTKAGGKVVIFWPHSLATSVAVLNTVHWVRRRVLNVQERLHPPEISLLRSKAWVAQILQRTGFELEAYSFGPRDFFVQAVIVAKKIAPAR
jgi:dolichol-phosphate mannosyltransferase